MSHPLCYTSPMKTIQLEEAKEIAGRYLCNATHIRFTYANHSYHEYPIDKLDEAIETHKWQRLGLVHGVKLDEKCEIKNEGMATGWRIDDFIPVAETDYSWDSEQTMSPASEYQRK